MIILLISGFVCYSKIGNTKGKQVRQGWLIDP